MEKRKINRIQRIFCEQVLQLLDDNSFLLNRKDWGIYNQEVVLPFFAGTTRGPFFTITPSFTVHINSLKAGIENITNQKILTNGIFVTGIWLDKKLGIEDVNSKVDGHNCSKINGAYYWKISEETDVKWMINWFMKYLELGGRDFIEKFKDHEWIYDFYKNIFLTYLAEDSNLHFLERSISLHPDAHTTMLLSLIHI